VVVGTLLGLDYPLDEIIKILPQRLRSGLSQFMASAAAGSGRPRAHTPDALKVLYSPCARIVVLGRPLCLFGCGGDRDEQVSVR
jgi:UDP-N-acetylmuramoyl-L-alanyl-D-glutamate--2,6-diaminopimelate ligase